MGDQFAISNCQLQALMSSVFHNVCLLLIVFHQVKDCTKCDTVSHRICVIFMYMDAVVPDSFLVTDREGKIPWCCLTFSDKIGAILIESHHE